ncbi:MAG: transposase [Gammaproteobacteria bacterium]|nr:transposase [Gammaproteobacteria bacterium]
MARIARVVVPLYPHHVTQRGNRRQQTFFTTKDYRKYIQYLSSAKDKAKVEILAYCLMPNHVHFVVVPKTPHSLANLFSDAHRRYTCRINIRHKWQGHLWQERFHSSVMDEQHLLATVRYIELNPVRAGLCQLPEKWPWSSVHAHLRKKDDTLVTVKPMLERISNWRKYLNTDKSSVDINTIRSRLRTGRPSGNSDFIHSIEKLTGRSLGRHKPGPKIE